MDGARDIVHRVLSESDRPLSFRELTQKSELDSSTVGIVLLELRQEGLVKMATLLYSAEVKWEAA